MSVLIVVESLFGNTMAVARAVATGLAGRGTEVTVLRCTDAPTDIPADVSLLLAGAPTHNSHLPSRSSRAQAAGKGAAQGDAPGLAEWIATLTPRRDLRVVTFDTTVGGAFAGSAAKAAAKLLRRRGFATPEQGPGFVVCGTPGPLRDGEEERARAWGEGLLSGVEAR
ncbi:MAG TPA: flavodoxin/nitric oxide synthase [Propionicimonas sp.]|uniref:flavodoxin family protein n=1 Tax=Propionicimonas sp. TaxID=1955623 RepID=UPI002F41B788